MCDIVYGVISVYGGDGCTVDISRRSTKTLYAKWLRDEDVENSQDRRGIWGGGGWKSGYIRGGSYLPSYIHRHLGTS